MVVLIDFLKRKSLINMWWPLPGLNWGPIDYESSALTKTELRGRVILRLKNLSLIYRIH